MPRGRRRAQGIRAIGSGLPLSELARLRQAAYRLFGCVLLYPDEEWLATLPGVGDGLLAESRALSRFPFWASGSRFLAALRRLDPGERPTLQATYAATFVTSADDGPCHLYESAYHPPDATPWVLAELDREYAEGGFSVAPSFHEPPDHAAVELEFMSLLCGEEAAAWERKDLAGALVSLERQAGFLDRHLVRWFPELARRAGERERDAFYGLATDAASAVIAHDLEIANALVRHYREVVRQ
jgi:TorA maturation chaperone TorD